MAMTGISADKDLVDLIADFCSNAKSDKYDYILAKIGKKDGKGKDAIILEEAPASSNPWDDKTFKYANVDAKGVPQHYNELLKKLKERLCRYAVVTYRSSGGSSHVVLINYVDDNCPVQQRMIYASTSKELLKKIKCSKAIQANDEDDCSWKTVGDHVTKSH